MSKVGTETLIHRCHSKCRPSTRSGKVTFICKPECASLDGRSNRHCRFEAAWAGKIEPIKRLTLANWGPDQMNSPLMVTVQDSQGFTPFGLAMYQRHFEVARNLLEIANVQFKGPDVDSARRHYTIAEEDSENSSNSDESDLEISSRIVDETFTFDKIAALRQSVGSRVSGKLVAASPPSDHHVNHRKYPICSWKMLKSGISLTSRKRKRT